MMVRFTTEFSRGVHTRTMHGGNGVFDDKVSIRQLVCLDWSGIGDNGGGASSQVCG